MFKSEFIIDWLVELTEILHVNPNTLTSRINKLGIKKTKNSI